MNTSSLARNRIPAFHRHHAKPGSLAYALLGAAELVQGVSLGQSLQTTLPALTKAWNLGPQDRGAIQAITFHALRHWARARAVRELLMHKPPQPPLMGAMVEVAIALAWPEDTPLYPQHTLVSQAVEAAKASPELMATQGVVNAVLRRWQRERTELTTQAMQTSAAQFNHPEWWIAKLKKIYPERYKAILKENSSQTTMTLRVNARKLMRDAYQQTLAENHIAAHAVGEDGLMLEQALPVEKLPGFAEGACSVQDFGAQLSALWLDAKQGQRVLDACAAPGGKAAHVLERADVRLLAIDSDAARLARVSETLYRLKLSAEIKHADASQPETWWDGEPFDRILLDAPCSASGVVRRHPDIAWLRREKDIATLAQTQGKLLKALWPLLKPGGRLLYCTCSVFPEEGEQQTTAFVANTPDAQLVTLDLGVFRGFLGHNLGNEIDEQKRSVLKLAAGVQLLPAGGGAHHQRHTTEQQRAHESHDGFYYALIEKQSKPIKPSA